MSLHYMKRFLASLACALLTVGAGHPTDPFELLTFRSIGPNPGRLDAAAGVPGEPSVYYVGGLGGLFKSTDGGASFSSSFDEPDVSSIGAISVAPSNPNILYVGTGEPNARNDIEPGNGMWRSSDAGKSWHHVGLGETAHIAQIAIDPRDADVVYVAAVGPIYGSGTQRGIFKSIDAGKTWRRILYADESTGASSVVIDPVHPSRLLAGMWTVWRRPWELNSGGPQDGVYLSSDAGGHWTRCLGRGFPSGLTGRIGLAYAPSNPSRIYALIESQQGVLWRSDDGGAHWQLINGNHALAQRPFYFSELSVDPRDDNHVFFISVDLLESLDGGKTTTTLGNALGDNHQMWIDPVNPARLIMVSDFSLGISFDSARHWIYPQIPVSQAYHIDTDDRAPYTVCGAFQDAGSACGPSNSKVGGSIAADWFATNEGESGWSLFDPADPKSLYGSGYLGTLSRFDSRTNQVLSISPWPLDAMGWAARDLHYRFQWTAPVAVTPLEPRAVYFAGNVLFKSSDEGRHWRVISPDLTRNDRRKQQPSGGPITLDATSVETYDTIFTIALSPLRRGQLWVGTDDGLLWLSRDDGKHWNDVTSRAPAMPAWSRVSSLWPSRFDPATAYVAFDAHLLGDRMPYLYATYDYGAHWHSISGDLVDASYSAVLKEDPFRRGLLYLGTGNGLYFSFDGGDHWRRVHSALPTVPVYDLTVQRRFDDLVVATHGRGIYILDDLHPIQELTESVAEQRLALFSTRTAYRWSTGRVTFASDTQLGTDPDDGANIDFWLRDGPLRTQSVSIGIFDGARVVRTLTIKNAHAGVNRIVWDLRYEGFKPVEKSAPWRMGGFAGPRAVPGVYRVAVTTAGLTQSGSVRVAADPQARASTAALKAQFAFLMEIHEDLARIGAMINALRAANTPAAAAVGAELFQPEAQATGDILRHPVHLYEQLSSLASDAESADAPPTTAQRRLLQYLESIMRVALAHSRLALQERRP